MARDPFYDLVSKMGKGRRDKVANAAGKPVIPPSAPGNVAMSDPMQMMSVNGRPDLMKPALPNGIAMSNPTPNPAMGPGGRPMLAKSDMSGGLGGAAEGPSSSGSLGMADGGMVTGGGFGTGPNGNPTYTGDWGNTVFGYDPSAGMPPKDQSRVPSIDNGYAVGPFAPQQTNVAETTIQRGLPSPPPVDPLGPIGYSPTAPARDPFASLFGGSIPTPQSKPGRFDDAMSMFGPTLQPTVGQIMQGPGAVFGKPTRFGNIPGPPRPNPGAFPTPKPNPMRGIGGPDLAMGMAGPRGGMTAPTDNMGEFGQFGTDPFGYGGLTGTTADGGTAGVMGSGFANAGYGSPSYGVNPVTAGHDLANAQQEGFSYGGYNVSDPSGAGATGKVVCTAMNEAYGFGGFRNTIWLAYAAAHLKPEHERGYHAIFVPLLAYARGGVSLPRQAMWLSLAHIARHRTADIRAEMRGGKRDRLGRMYRAVLEPLCYVVGKVLG